jgi:hypothetical protein
LSGNWFWKPRWANCSGARYNRAVSRLVIGVAFIVLAAACGNPPTVKNPNGGSGTGGTGTGGGGTGGTGGGGTLKDIGCAVPGCVFHAGTATYFTCLSTAQGACAHFGAACTPELACMYDPAAKAYKQCTKPVEGVCQAWGSACAPASKCMFDASDNLYKQCDDVSNGSCKRFGALCPP